MAPVPINPPVALLGTSNVVLRGHGRRHFVRDFPGPLSVKCVIHGAGQWRTEDGDFRLDEHALLVLNHRQPYDLTIDEREPVSTCCLFFAGGFVESVFESAARPVEAALDDPAGAPSMSFMPRLETEASGLLGRIRQVHRATASSGPSETWLEEQFLLAARELIDLDRHVRQQTQRVPAARPATRVEIYRRLCRARDFMQAYRDRPVELAEVARAACLSPYHFHRLFRETFHETPHQYLTRIRLERAAHLLSRSELPVTEICLECGFTSLGSFSSLFRRHFGNGPRAFQQGERIQQV
jgi:AraC-like DNA-binding protein